MARDWVHLAWGRGEAPASQSHSASTTQHLRTQGPRLHIRSGVHWSRNAKLLATAHVDTTDPRALHLKLWVAAPYT